MGVRCSVGLGRLCWPEERKRSRTVAWTLRPGDPGGSLMFMRPHGAALSLVEFADLEPTSQEPRGLRVLLPSREKTEHRRGAAQACEGRGQAPKGTGPSYRPPRPLPGAGAAGRL